MYLPKSLALKMATSMLTETGKLSTFYSEYSLKPKSHIVDMLSLRFSPP
jgi:hypothetical protein